MVTNIDGLIGLYYVLGNRLCLPVSHGGSGSFVICTAWWLLVCVLWLLVHVLFNFISQWLQVNAIGCVSYLTHAHNTWLMVSLQSDLCPQHMGYGVLSNYNT